MSRALNSCQQHEFTSNQTSDANNASRGTINHVVAPLRPMTSQDKLQNGTCVQRNLQGFLWSLADPGRKLAEKRKPELLKLLLLQHKPPSDFDCLDRLHTGRSEQEPTLLGVLYTFYAGFGSWIWQHDLIEGCVCMCVCWGWGGVLWRHCWPQPARLLSDYSCNIQLSA